MLTPTPNCRYGVHRNFTANSDGFADFDCFTLTVKLQAMYTQLFSETFRCLRKVFEVCVQRLFTTKFFNKKKRVFCTAFLFCLLYDFWRF